MHLLIHIAYSYCSLLCSTRSLNKVIKTSSFVGKRCLYSITTTTKTKRTNFERKQITDINEVLFKYFERRNESAAIRRSASKGIEILLSVLAKKEVKCKIYTKKNYGK